MAMSLRSKLFTQPFNQKLEACLVKDSAHIIPGSLGDHVKRIQIALNQLSEGKVFLVPDGKYGPLTAAAVKVYKNAPSRRILRSGQSSADNIVGKLTIRSLDDEMEIFENEEPAVDLFVSSTILGSPHDHDVCPLSGFTAPGSGGRVNHFGTPVNPGPGRKINLGGEGETKYLGFEDFITNPTIGPMRPLTATIPPHSVTNMCIRDSPITKDGSKEKGRDEILRIAQSGCRFVFCGDVPQFRKELLSLETVLQHIVMNDPRFRQGIAEALAIIIR